MIILVVPPFKETPILTPWKQQTFWSQKLWWSVVWFDVSPFPFGRIFSGSSGSFSEKYDSEVIQAVTPFCQLGRGHQQPFKPGLRELTNKLIPKKGVINSELPVILGFPWYWSSLMLGNLKFDVARPWTPDPHIHTSYELGVSTTLFGGVFFKPGNLPCFSAKFIQGKVCGSPILDPGSGVQAGRFDSSKLR